MRHEIHRNSKRTPGEFMPLFDWDTAEEMAEVLDTLAAVKMLREACLRQIERGGLIVRFCFGARLANCRREDFGPSAPAGPLRADYEAGKYCDPLGALLHDTPFGAGVLADAARLLGVDEYWMAGFLHGVDHTKPFMSGKRFADFDASPMYRQGREVGLEIAEEFIHIKGGWEVETAA